MSDGSSWIEIILLAMLAGFIGLRLVSVLGKRTGHERPVGDSFRPGAPEVVSAPVTRGLDLPQSAVVAVPPGTDKDLAPALQAVADVDSGFDPERFVGGAKAAYRLILEGFWSGNAGTMEGLVSDEILENFGTAIEEREGARLDNKLVSVDSAAITRAEMIGQMAEVTVRFDARVAAGNGEPEATNDVWTFSRHIGSGDPAWLLIATDDDDNIPGN
ncbi:hypothetical protein GCM10011529_19270 [Polymorphobacter glacialis]|uniref:Tim44-like domain-containing protein n=1 Tax=Sandarakinorhabdus glacialis TaxID=1614636 RepID=A0A916ZTW7_9SPHN|nr:Tim44/TimA family putative adaptor protein [Polymorphobacter glacialis]GGE13028.1 hypothetical protein GCM10011529_19270 [Polymorphobacter glacialis]